MIFPPLIFFLMLAFFFLAIFLLPFLLVGMIGNAFIKLGISPSMIFWLLILTLLGSLVNIPIYTLEGREVMAEQVITYYGMRVRLPRMPTRHQTVLAVNVGGALIPMGICAYLLYKMAFSLGMLITLGAVIFTINRLARPVKGLGIAVPGLVPPILAALGAYLLCPPELRAPSAYVASTMGTLIGADLLKLKEISQLGAPVASIGGAGTFDAIFLGGIIAVLLS
jgi:uncharacterized membrane protein